MNNIPFKQFLLKYNFYENDENLLGEDNDTQIIRIKLNDILESEDTSMWSTWFEFGMKTLFNIQKQTELINKIFSKDILNSYVSSIRTLENGVLQIELSPSVKDED